ncbi:hypothetical protein [Leptospira sp. GIMC2001]|uniref:hypothetical protein n=1 Tax=Leptospira sp. GIMC2001 TaxID=1513297 RepID=UPI002349006B|nr:hypothetical protein [Leptospira sp. GIMC2001]WCL49773.1 hypothetical protein O4O04_02845 [Leptospira sp. GIMC2001]
MRNLQKIRSNPSVFLKKLRQSVIELSGVKEYHKRVAILSSLLEYIVNARDDGQDYQSIKIFKELDGIG